MKHIHYILLIILLPLWGAGGLSAQSSYPIFVQPTLMPPYSLRLSDYGQSGSRGLMVTMRVNDVTVTNLPVRLHIKMETFDGRGVETVPNIAVVPTYLGGGETAIFFGEDLAPYFNINNLVFKGYSKEQYQRTGQLPEGFYRITIEVRHFGTGRLISNQGTAMAWFALGKPPVLKYPDNAAELGEIAAAPLTFTWQPNNVGVPGANIQYTFEMWEMRIAGINENVITASMPPFYNSTQFHNTLVVQPAALNLEPGMRYAWRVTASDVMGNVPFENNGHSEVRTFTFMKKCDCPVNLTVTQKNKDAVYTWNVGDRHTSFIIEAEDVTTGYNTQKQIFTNKYELKQLDYDHNYRLRVKGVCNGNAMYPSDASKWLDFTLTPPPTLEEICPTCSCGIVQTPMPELTNTTWRTDLKAGDIVIKPDGKTRYEIITAHQTEPGVYEGQFYILWSYYGVKALANYSNLRVNTDNKIRIDYDYETVDDPSMLVDVDKVKEAVEAVSKTLTNTNIKDTLRLTVPINDIYVNEHGKVVVASIGAKGKVTETEVSGNRTLVQGTNGEEYVVLSNGKVMGVDEFEATGGNTYMQEEYNTEKEGKAQPSVQFTASQQQSYGFDAYNTQKAAIQNQYPELKANYRSPFKSVESYKTDKVAVSDAGDNVTFRTEWGIPAQKTDNDLTIRGSSNGDETILYAYQTQDSAETVAGKLNILSFDKQTKKLYLVSVNGAPLPDKSSLQTELNRIYAPAVTDWLVSTANPVSVAFPNGQMTHGGSSAISVYNADQKAVIQAFGTMEKDALYLFFVQNVQGKDADGYMPLQYQSGFLYTTDVQTIAHEIAHGAFNLYHTFSEQNFIASQGSTNNLMDYSSKDELWTYQWKLVHNPKNVLLKFLQEEEEGEAQPDYNAVMNDIVLIRRCSLYNLEMKIDEKAIEKTIALSRNRKFLNYTTKGIILLSYSKKGTFSDITFTKSTSKDNNGANSYRIKIGDFAAVYCSSEEDRNVIYDFLTKKENNKILFDVKKVTLSSTVYTFEKIYNEVEKLQADIVKSKKDITETDKLILNIPLIQWQLGWHYASIFYVNWLTKGGDITADKELTDWLQSWNIYTTRINEFEKEFKTYLDKPLKNPITKKYYAINSALDLFVDDPHTNTYVMSDLQKLVIDTIKVKPNYSLQWDTNRRKYSNFAITTIAANEDAASFSSWLATFGSVTIQHCFSGKVSLNDDKKAVIDISETYIYIEDGFKFKEKNQPLGMWKNDIFFPESPTISASTWLFNENNDLYLTNDKLTNFSVKYGIGKDFSIFIQPILTNTLFNKIIINKKTNEITYQK